MDDFPTVYWSAWASDATFLPGSELPAESQGGLWAVLTIVFYGDKLALADIDGRGLCIPSGKIEPGESIDDAAEREAYEETGAVLAANRRRLIGCYRLVSRPTSLPGTHPGSFLAAPPEAGREGVRAGSESTPSPFQKTPLNPPASGGKWETGAGGSARNPAPSPLAGRAGVGSEPAGGHARRRYCPVFVAEALGFEPVPAGSESHGVLFAAIEEVADVYYTWDPLMAAVFEYADEQRQELFPAGTPLADIIKG
jgi:ADP-ribose pyrophosphatase YjhB (NUDIX family)